MDTRSLYTPLREEGLTTLKIRYDWKTDKGYMYAAKEWIPTSSGAITARPSILRAC